jgi:hypothetical protein
VTNRPKAKGTAGETAVTRYAQSHGFPYAERITLSGRYDRGDVMLLPGLDLIVEVKAGKQAQYASRAQIEAWLEETDVERENAGATIGILVTQPRGVGTSRPELWNTWFVRGSDIVDCAADALIFNYPIAVLLEHALTMLRRAGWGDPIPETPINQTAEGAHHD